jgi:hypothetical protein
VVHAVRFFRIVTSEDHDDALEHPTRRVQASSTRHPTDRESTVSSRTNGVHPSPPAVHEQGTTPRNDSQDYVIERLRTKVSCVNGLFKILQSYNSCIWCSFLLYPPFSFAICRIFRHSVAPIHPKMNPHRTTMVVVTVRAAKLPAQNLVQPPLWSNARSAWTGSGMAMQLDFHLRATMSFTGTAFIPGC